MNDLYQHRPIRIGVDARSLSGPLTGIGTYVHETLKELSRDETFEFFLYCCPNLPQELVTINKKWKIRSICLPRQVAIKTIFGLWASMDNVDVFWATQTISPVTKRPIVSTVHDLNHIFVPETMSWGTKLAHNLWFNSNVRHASALVSNSHATANRLQNSLNIRSTAVAPPGVSENFKPLSQKECNEVRHKYGISGDYLLAVGTLEPRKNIVALIQAHKSLFELGMAPELILVGGKGWKLDMTELATNSVRILGYVERTDLPALYAGARAYVIPSIYEGYGMPAAEAKACGCTVVASDIPELHEATQGDAVFISPTQEGIARGIMQALATPASHAQVPHYWRDTAEVYKSVFVEVVEKIKSNLPAR